MKRTMRAAALLLVFGLPAWCQETFPEREAAARQADSFFRQLRPDVARVRQLPTLLADRNYQTAFLNLSEALAGDPFVARLCVLLERERFDALARFRLLAGELAPATAPRLMAQLGIDNPLLLAQLAVHGIVRRFQANELSAALAMRHWLSLLHLFQQGSARSRDAADAGLMLLAAELDLFKAGRRWQKKGRRLLRRHPAAAGDRDLRRLVAARAGPL